MGHPPGHRPKYNLRMSSAPLTEARWICVADRDAVVLSAVISSYLFEPGTYLPLFIFPGVNAPMTDGDEVSSEAYLSNAIAGSAATFINNAWARMGGSPYLILVGLTADQISYLSIPKGVRVVNITALADVSKELGALPLQDRAELKARPSDVLKGLFLAQKAGKRLVVDEGADSLTTIQRTSGGIIVVEDGDVGSVVAVNYASSLDADLLVVPKIERRELRAIHTAFQAWKVKGDDAHLEVVRNAVSERIGTTSLRKFDYVTFFTIGLPYSFVIENIIPCSNVHLGIKPDLFVLNSIIFDKTDTIHSTVVFSPLFFPDEETTWLTKFVTDNRYYLRQLIGRDASFANLDFTLQHFPYSLFHICSHGGEVEGWEVSEEFIDRDGKKHVIEYDEVVGCDLIPDENGGYRVHRKAIFRRLDGFEWMSEELERQEIPHYVFTDMWKALYKEQRTKLNTNAKRRKKKGPIATSCAIRCCDTIHQGELHVLASHSSPLIFNNTCWSWYEVSSFFLSCGARGYIGTLWAIDNDAAILGAETFYGKIFSGTVLHAFDEAVKAIAHTKSKDIYVFWGLHFTKLRPADDAKNSRAEVFSELARAFARLRDHIKETKSQEGRRNATRVLELLIGELKNNFGAEDLKIFELERVTQVFRRKGPGKEEVPIHARRSLDHPAEYRKPGDLDDGTL
jgi:hypothetical protein